MVFWKKWCQKCGKTSLIRVLKKNAASVFSMPSKNILLKIWGENFSSTVVTEPLKLILWLTAKLRTKNTKQQLSRILKNKSDRLWRKFPVFFLLASCPKEQVQSQWLASAWRNVRRVPIFQRGTREGRSLGRRRNLRGSCEGFLILCMAHTKHLPHPWAYRTWHTCRPAWGQGLAN